MNEVINSDHDHLNVTSLQLKTAIEKFFSVCVCVCVFLFIFFFQFSPGGFFLESFNLASGLLLDKKLKKYRKARANI